MNRPSRIAPRISASIRPPSEALADALSRTAELIRTGSRFLIVGHADPDGDVMGSSLALFHILRALSKDVTVFNVDPVPFNFHFLAGATSVVHTLPEDARFDATFVLDCSDMQRLGDAFPEAGWGEQRVIIDHHKGITDPADIVLHDPRAAATGELVFRLAGALGVALDETIAECLYCSLVTDTGSFRYASTTPTALIIAGELVSCGVDVWRVTSHVYESNPVERVQLLAKVLQTLDVTPDGRLACVRISRGLFEEGGRREAIFDGFINYARSIRGVEVAAQLREISDDHFEIVFRSAGQVHVGQLAALFQGRGGQNGAICEMHGSWESVRDQLHQALRQALMT